ncbi:FKBP-type peptidyl-prolyl cis-trans isomerase [Thioalkalivibrio sp.]|uniref:FKBP-type peptidyl-prolyl cis-trans isomerase n=1 Tax=Thioalkalivibrio sp. TaxID=2093813 RepID=UPI003975098D
MLRVILFSLLALVVVFVVAHSLGLTPEQIEDQILLADINAEEGAAYREANAREPGVVTTANGLQIEVLLAGDGPVPREDDWVQVHYRGMHIDGREFENSWRKREPATVAVADTIPGWRQALVSIPVGTRVRLVLPPELAYGRPGGGHIGPEETLVFELELLAIVEPEQPRDRDEWEKPVPGLR